jgi:hypothetical protein
MAHSKEERRTYDRAYRVAHRKRRVAQIRNWRYRNAEHMREYHRARYQANRDAICERRKQARVIVPEYTAWQNMKQRCANPNNRSYRWYGARGISVCKHWLNSFANFYADMGPRPSPKHSIDRIVNDSGYFPDNCRWATKQQQVANMRKPARRPYLLAA